MITRRNAEKLLRDASATGEVRDSDMPRDFTPQAGSVREARALVARLLRDGVSTSRARVLVSGRVLGPVGCAESFILAEVAAAR